MLECIVASVGMFSKGCPTEENYDKNVECNDDLLHKIVASNDFKLTVFEKKRVCLN